jgi:hypothetical protein
MADFNSSLPVRTELDGDVVVKVGDGLVPSQHLTVNTDGSVNVTDNGGSLTVDTDNGPLEVEATDFDIRNLTFAQDKVDVSGSDVTATVTATDLDIRDLVFATDKVDVSGSDVTATVTATDLDIRDLAFATDKVDVSGSTVALDAATLAALETITVEQGTSPWVVSSTDLDIRDLTHVSDSIKVGDGTDFLAVNSDGSINVVVQEDVGTEVVDYDTAAAVASGATSNHDQLFTNGGRLYSVLATASEKLKIEVQIETGAATGVFQTVVVGFNSTATPDIERTLAKYALIPVGARVRVIRTNRGNVAQDVYSTIIGIEN